MEAKVFLFIFSFFIVIELSRCYHLSSHSKTFFSIDSLCTTNSSNTINYTSTGLDSYGIVSVKSRPVLNNSQNIIPVIFNCTLTLNAPRGYQLHLGFSDISPGGGLEDYIEVLTTNKQHGTFLRESRNCPSENCRDLEFDASTIVIKFQTSTNQTRRGFVGMVTVFSKADEHGNCHTTEQYRCHNRHCIWKGLYCNQHNHCGDLSDEPLGCKPFAEQAIWGILVIVFGVVSFCIFLPLFCYFAIRGQRRRMKVTQSVYEPIPTSINDRPGGNYAAILVGPRGNYGTNFDSSSSTEVPQVHQKFSPNMPYQ